MRNRHTASENTMGTRLTAIAVLVGTLLTGTAAAQAGGGAGPDRQPENARIGTAAVSERAITTTAAGRLRPAATAAHPAATAGVVTSVSVALGQSVKKGRQLFTVEREDGVGRYVPHVVYARIDGVVAEVLVRENNEIRAGENGVTIIDTREHVLSAQISDKDAFRLTVGIQVVGRIAGGPEIRGTLASRTPEPDYKTGLFTITVRFPAGGGIHAGQFVSVQLPVETERGIFVRQNLLVRRYGRYFIWTILEDNTLRMQEVVTGTAYGDMILVRRGLEEGDRYLQRVTGKERDGMPLEDAGN